MPEKLPGISVLIVNISGTADKISDAMDPARFAPVFMCKSEKEAKQLMAQRGIDLVAVCADTAEPALRLAEQARGPVLWSAQSRPDRKTRTECENAGILAVSDDSGLETALSLICAMRARLAQLETRTQDLKLKLEDMKLINRAKLLLMSRLNMSETQAHRYIEKAAMDGCAKRRDVAAAIIRTYEE